MAIIRPYGINTTTKQPAVYQTGDTIEAVSGSLLYEYLHTGTTVNQVTASGFSTYNLEFQTLVGQQNGSGGSTFAIRINGITSSDYSYRLHYDDGSAWTRVAGSSVSSAQVARHDTNNNVREAFVQGFITATADEIIFVGQFMATGTGGPQCGVFGGQLLSGGPITSILFNGLNDAEWGYESGQTNHHVKVWGR